MAWCVGVSALRAARLVASSFERRDMAVGDPLFQIASGSICLGG